MGKILLILSKRSAVQNIESILSSEAYDVVSAMDELSGKEMIFRDTPSLVIVDAVFGETFIEELKDSFPKLSILCFMNEKNARLAVELMKTGALDCIYNPLRRTEILEVIRHALGYPLVVQKSKTLYDYYLAMPNYVKILSGLFILVIALWFIAGSFIKVRESLIITLPYKNPTGITSDGQNIWISNWYTQSVYKYTQTDNSLKLTDTKYFANFGPLTISYSDGYLWTAGNDLFLRQHTVNGQMDAVNMYNLGELAPSGVAVIGNSLWICDSSRKRIYRYRLSAQITLINTYTCPFDSPVGLYYDGEHIWMADGETNSVYQFTWNAEGMQIVLVYNLPYNAMGKMEGFYVSDKYFYIVFSGSPSRMERHSKSSLDVKRPGKDILSGMYRITAL